MTACMQKHTPQSLRIKLISIILASAFTLSTLGYGPISAWAQESSNYPGQGMQNANPPPNGMNPCLVPHGNYTGMHHVGQGNYTGNGMRHLGQGNYTGMHHVGQGNYTGMHQFRQGNYTGNGMHPCPSQTPNQPVSGNNIVPQNTNTTSSTSGTQAPIPSWIKNNAKWWSSGAIDDSTFAQGIQYMIQQKIVKIPPTQSSQAAAGVKIPQWVRNDAAWWSSNQIDDSTFVGAIQYLVQSGIISS
jgi:hypothetical protein